MMPSTLWSRKTRRISRVILKLCKKWSACCRVNIVSINFSRMKSIQPWTNRSILYNRGVVFQLMLMLMDCAWAPLLVLSVIAGNVLSNSSSNSTLYSGIQCQLPITSEIRTPRWSYLLCRESDLRERAFAYTVPCVWNSLPTDLKDYNLSLAVFKRRLKSYFLTMHNL